MSTRFDEALDFFLQAEREYQSNKTPQNEKLYGLSKYALFVISKEASQALSYYASGGNDNGKLANEVLKTRPTKECKTC